MLDTKLSVIEIIMVMVLIGIFISGVRSVNDSIVTVANHNTNLEKVHIQQVVTGGTGSVISNKPSAETSTVRGSDVTGTIRYYLGSNVKVTVSGWGNSVVYGGGGLNREWQPEDFSGLGSDLEFYEAEFTEVVEGNNVTYTKL